MIERKLRVYRLRFKEPVHLGEQGVGLEAVSSLICHSDTLWGALVDVFNRLKGSPGPFSSFWQGDKIPFLMTSAFPYVGETLYLPRPLCLLKVPDEKFKEFKRVSYFPLSVFKRWMESGKLEPADVDEAIESWGLLTSRIVEKTGPRVAIGHAAFASQIYYTGRTYFAADSGLWFGVEFHDEAAIADFEAALRLLGENGLGGLRSVGHGTFDFEAHSLTLEVPESTSYMLLSVLSPTGSESLKGFYSLIERRGWALSSLTKMQARRKIVNFLREGSILPAPDPGKIVDVTPPDWPEGNHRVYRYGLGYYVPIRSEGP